MVRLDGFSMLVASSLLLLLSCRPAETPGTAPLGAEHEIDRHALTAAPWTPPESVPVVMYLVGAEPGIYHGYAMGDSTPFLWGLLDTGPNATHPVLRTMNEQWLWRSRVTRQPLRGLDVPGPSHVLVLHGMTGAQVSRPVVVEIERTR